MPIYPRNSEAKINDHVSYFGDIYGHDSAKTDLDFQKAVIKDLGDEYAVVGLVDNITEYKNGKDCNFKFPNWLYFIVHKGDYKRSDFKEKKEIDRSQDVWEKFFCKLIEDKDIDCDIWFSAEITIEKNDFAELYLEDPQENAKMKNLAFRKIFDKFQLCEEQPEANFIVPEQKNKAAGYGKGNFNKSQTVYEKASDKEKFLLDKLNELDSSLKENDFTSLADFCVQETKMPKGTQELANRIIELSLQLMA